MRELRSVLDSRKRRSAPGSDGITYQMLRNIDSSLLPQLLAAYNTVWRTGELPASRTSTRLDYFVSGIGLELSAEKTEALLVHPNPLARYQVGKTFSPRLSAPLAAQGEVPRHYHRSSAQLEACHSRNPQGHGTSPAWLPACSPVARAALLYLRCACTTRSLPARTLYSVQLVGLKPIQWESLDVRPPWSRATHLWRCLVPRRLSHLGGDKSTPTLPACQGRRFAARSPNASDAAGSAAAIDCSLAPTQAWVGTLSSTPHSCLRCHTAGWLTHPSTSGPRPGDINHRSRTTRLASSSRVMCALCIRMRVSLREHLRAYFRGLASQTCAARQRFFSGCASEQPHRRSPLPASGSGNPKCVQCPADETIDHILLQCPGYDDHRRRLFGAFSRTGLPHLCLDELLFPSAQHSKVLQAFLRAVGFFRGRRPFTRL
ncbi:hypothetical protein HPB52_015953 [Rhipicephalus sanguineus]|uniref:Tick transposon n=1 Tax=Rhipicephalus sanguineus TaxID=34632 RepID=A0A9D4PWU8_RHISA|nr:hypothetical protein HPB52_015953 [Rhipicephalus sanguineus]